MKLLVPSVGSFYTQLPLDDAFRYQDGHRYISRRRFVAPSFNDVRLVLNTAQVMGALRSGGLDLVTFDGDVTLYEDGACLTEDNPVIPRIIRLLQRDCKVGIVTAAGYADAPRYYTRLKGLLDAIHKSPLLSANQKSSIVVMGGESNFLFRYDADNPVRLTYVPRNEWLLDEMVSWHEDDIKELLDIAESSLSSCASNLNMPVAVLRKDRAVGVYPTDLTRPVGREQLEETVLVVQNTLERSAVGSRLPFSAFNGMFTFPLHFYILNDILTHYQVETMSSSILATSPGVCVPASSTLAILIVQRHYTLETNFSLLVPMISRYAHRFLSFLSRSLANRWTLFQARLASTTAWIASPTETVELLDELDEHGQSQHKTNRS